MTITLSQQDLLVEEKQAYFLVIDNLRIKALIIINATDETLILPVDLHTHLTRLTEEGVAWRKLEDFAEYLDRVLGAGGERLNKSRAIREEQ